MMNRKILITAFLAFAFLLILAAPALAQEPGKDEVVFGENFVLESEQTHRGDLAILGGNATLESNSVQDGDLFVLGGNLTAESASTIEGDLAVFGGNVKISGTVNGDVGVLGGNVDLADAAVVNGNVGLVGGHLDQAPGATVTGDVQGLNRFRTDFDPFEDHDRAPGAPIPPAPPGGFGEARSAGVFYWVGKVFGDIFWNVALLVVLGLITWLVTAFMPEQMFNVRQTLTGSAPLSFGVGLLTSIVAAVLVPVAVILLITICLAIVPIVAYVALGIATLFGWIVIGHVIGERLLTASGRSQPGLVFSSIVGVSVLTLIAKMPVIGLIDCIGFIGTMFGALVAMVGLGAVLLTRFGTRPYPAASGSSSYPGSGSPSSGVGSGYSGSRVRWTDPEPDVSEEETIVSEDELKARIRAALAEADEVKEAKAKVEAERTAPAEGEETIPDEGAEDQAEDDREEVDEQSNQKESRPRTPDDESSPGV